MGVLGSGDGGLEDDGRDRRALGHRPQRQHPLVPVVTLPDGKTVGTLGVQTDLQRVDERLNAALPGARIASYASTGSEGLVPKDGRTAFALVYPVLDRPVGNNVASMSRTIRYLRVSGGVENGLSLRDCHGIVGVMDRSRRDRRGPQKG